MDIFYNITGTSNQNLANKFKKDTFSTRKLEQIAGTLACEFEGYFVEKNGNKS